MPRHLPARVFPGLARLIPFHPRRVPDVRQVCWRHRMLLTLIHQCRTAQQATAKEPRSSRSRSRVSSRSIVGGCDAANAVSPRGQPANLRRVVRQPTRGYGEYTVRLAMWNGGARERLCSTRKP